MSAVFADTSFFVALMSRRDIHHDLADRLGREIKERILTTHWVLLEVANYFAASRQRATATELIESILADTKLECLPASSESFDEGWNLYRSRKDKSWSLTDCISFNVMRFRGLRKALTSDHHFEQAGFAVLLK